SRGALVPGGGSRRRAAGGGAVAPGHGRKLRHVHLPRWRSQRRTKSEIGSVDLHDHTTRHAHRARRDAVTGSRHGRSLQASDPLLHGILWRVAARGRGLIDYNVVNDASLVPISGSPPASAPRASKPRRPHPSPKPSEPVPSEGARPARPMNTTASYSLPADDRRRDWLNRVLGIVLL